jgi:hypothetical protein
LFLTNNLFLLNLHPNENYYYFASYLLLLLDLVNQPSYFDQGMGKSNAGDQKDRLPNLQAINRELTQERSISEQRTS